LSVTPYFSIRSQSENAARELVGAGWNTQINLCNIDNWYGNFSVTPEYTRSLKPYNIAECLFGNTNCYNPCETACTTLCKNDCNDLYRIKISGSNIENRGSCDWLADYFGLPTDYQSCITFEPRIDNFLIDLNFYVGLDTWCPGLYFNIHAPIVHTRWDLNMCEKIQNSGENPHWPGYFNNTINLSGTSTVGIVRNDLVSNFSKFIGGCETINSNEFIFNPLCSAKIDCSSHKKTALSDIQMELGWNIWCNNDYHVGLNIRTAAPTGTQPTGTYLFEPIVGNGKHWELGAGMSSHWTFWYDECNCKSMAFYIDANITHLFKTRQCRTFDLYGKPLSRYMLAAQFKTPVENLLAGAEDPDVQPSKQFAGIYSPVANLTTFAVDVSIGAQADIACMLQYNHNNWSCDIGYNFWGRSCEQILCPCSCCPCLEDNTWALKGDAFMYGFTQDVEFESHGIPLSATQPKATIYQGTNNYPNGDTSDSTNPISWAQNPGVANRRLAWDKDEEEIFSLIDGTDQGAQAYTSLDPVLINFCDIDLCGAQTKGLSHKLFAHIDYTWCENECRTPYLGIGFEVEFAQKTSDSCYDNCNTCLPCNVSNGLDFATECIPCYNPTENSCSCCNDCCTLCALSQWGIWIKGGFGF